MKTDTFSGYHPVVNFLYFLAVLVLSMFFMHPVCLGISLLAAMCYFFYLKGPKAVGFQLKFMLPLLLLTAALNPLFNHEGATILLYFKGGNPLTLEAIWYGIASASMVITVVTWFACCNVVMTSDKFVYLFGKLIPALSLILSMTLRFVPRFTAQIKVVTQAQRCVGRDVSSGNVLQRIKNALTILSIVITWALENAIETADSMRSRGYGAAKRTNFTPYRFTMGDGALLAVLAAATAVTLWAGTAGYARAEFVPNLYIAGSDTPLGAAGLAAWAVLLLIPTILHLWEDMTWRILRSKI